MAMKELDIKIMPDGTVRVQVLGAHGHDCDRFIKVFENIFRCEARLEHTHDHYLPHDHGIEGDLEQNAGHW